MKVFVYGTLREKECNHYLLNGATCLSMQCWTEGRLYDSGCGYPFLAKMPGEKVYGELYQIDEHHLKTLDELEGYYGLGKNNLYDRKEQTIFSDTESLQAFVYILPEGRPSDIMPPINGGDWCLYQKKD